MSGSGRFFPSGCPGVVGRPVRMSGSGRETLRMSLSGQEALPDVRDPLPDVW